MYSLSRQYTRPNASVQWHSDILDSSDFMAHLTENYLLTGKLLTQTYVRIDDLNRVYEGIFDSLESLNEYDNDQILQNYWTLKDSYQDQVGIVAGPKVISEI